MSLREGVARRLSGVWDMSVLGLDFDSAPYGWLCLADEAIRFAEWTRRQKLGDYEALPTTHHVVPYPPGQVEIRGVKIYPAELTYPPDDFAP